MDLDEAQAILDDPPAGLTQERWRDAYLTVQEEHHRQLALTLRAAETSGGGERMRDWYGPKGQSDGEEPTDDTSEDATGED